MQICNKVSILIILLELKKNKISQGIQDTFIFSVYIFVFKPV